MNLSAIPWRARVGLVVAGYAAVIGVSATLITLRYLVERQNPADFNGGMAAGGDWIMELFLVGLLLIPTFFLVLLIRNSETAYTKFAKVLLGFGISALASAAVLAIPAVGQSNSWLGYICLSRLGAFPMTLVGFVGCCALAKFKRPRRLILYSLLIEIVAFVLLWL